MNRRGLLFNAAGLVVGVPTLVRAEPFKRVESAVKSGFFQEASWGSHERALCPAVRLVFQNDSVTGWMQYDPRCFFGKSASHPDGKAKAIEVSMWAPNGMRVNHIIRVD